MPDKIASVHRQLVYGKGTQAAIEFAEQQVDAGKLWTTHELVEAVVDAVWDPIKDSKG